MCACVFQKEEYIKHFRALIQLIDAFIIYCAQTRVYV